MDFENIYKSRKMILKILKLRGCDILSMIIKPETN